MRIEALLAKLWVIRQGERAGFHIQPMKRYCPVDARQYEGNPLALSYRYPRRRLLLAAPVAWGFGLFNSHHGRSRPLATVIPEALASPDRARSMIRDALSRFYAEWQPNNAADYFELSPHEAGRLAELPAWLSSWPWDPLNTQEKRAQRLRTEERENGRVLGHDLSIEEGWKFCGPVTERKLDIEVERLVRVLTSIRAHGVLRHDGVDGDISTLVLSHPDGRWRWQALVGQHRYAVISALGQPRIDIRVEYFVRREEVMMWPGVVSGLFTPAAALKVFDACFDSAERDAGTASAERDAGTASAERDAGTARANAISMCSVWNKI